MRITIIPLAFFLSAIIFLTSCNVAYAKENDIGQSQIHPAHPLYFLKTIRESLELKFAGTKRVTFIRRLEFATRRLREVKSLINVGNFELIIPTLERYWSEVSSLPQKDIEDQEIVKMIQDNLIIHLEVLKEVYDKVDNLRAKMAIRSVVNRIIQRADVPNYGRLPVCNFLAKEASASSLNEVEKAILSERAESCFKNSRQL